MSRRGESGQALGLAVVVLFLVTASLALVAAELQLQMRASRDEGRRFRLRLLADAAVATTLAELERSEFYKGLPDSDFEGGTISSRVFPAASGQFRIEAWAQLEGGRRGLRVEALRRRSGQMRVIAWRPLPKREWNGSVSRDPIP